MWTGDSSFFFFFGGGGGTIHCVGCAYSDEQVIICMVVRLKSDVIN